MCCLSKACIHSLLDHVSSLNHVFAVWPLLTHDAIGILWNLPVFILLAWGVLGSDGFCAADMGRREVWICPKELVVI